MPLNYPCKYGNPQLNFALDYNVTKCTVLFEHVQKEKRIHAFYKKNGTTSLIRNTIKLGYSNHQFPSRVYCRKPKKHFVELIRYNKKIISFVRDKHSKSAVGKNFTPLPCFREISGKFLPLLSNSMVMDFKLNFLSLQNSHKFHILPFSQKVHTP